MVTFTQITYFNAVCEYKNVTKAANALFVSRTAVSRALKDLENEWGIILFKRSRTGVELTEDGEKVKNIFKDFNNAYMTLKKDINERQRSEKPFELRIGITSTTGNKFFPDFFKGFIDLYPDTRLRIQELTTFNSIDELLGGSLDFSITPHIINEEEYDEFIEKVPTYITELVFCVGKNHPLSTRKTITDKESLIYEKASLLVPLPSGDLTDEEFRQLFSKESNEMFIRSSQHQLIQKVVANNFATITLPREIAENWPDIHMISFDPPKLFPVYVIWNKNIKQSEIHQAFQKYIKEYKF